MTSWELTCIWLFWLSVGIVAYAYVGYPALIWLLSRLFGSQPAPPLAPTEWPSVSLLIAAYNEESEMVRRIENALAMDYPRDRFEIAIASDGSSDSTCDIVRRYADQHIKLFEYPERRGKPSVLNRSVPRLNGEIVVFSDANSLTEPEALKNLVRWFSDPSVGSVCGRLILIDSVTGRNEDSVYWRYETFLKKCENRLGALLGANGAIYALRREWYPDIPDNTIVDDFVIPLRARLTHSCRIIYDSQAVAHEETPKTIRTEFNRRSRIGAGGYQSIGLLWKLLSPRQGWVTFTFLNHKIIRWICPFPLILALGTNIALIHIPLFQLIFGLQMGFYFLAAIGPHLPAGPLPCRIARIATMFTGMNAALFVGFFRWLFSTQQAAWTRTTRLAEPVEAHR